MVTLAIIVAFNASLAQGHNGGPYTWRGVVAGLAYLAAVVTLRVRS